MDNMFINYYLYGHAVAAQVIWYETIAIELPGS